MIIQFALLLAFINALASEGLFPIADLKKLPDYKNSYVEFKGCGGIRIHHKLPYVLTALHCVTNELDSISPQRTISLGNHFAFDSINYFEKLDGKRLKDGSKVLKTGGCFTGMDPEVLQGETKTNRLLAFQCALKDWAIIEVAKSNGSTCSAVAKSQPKKVFALGASKNTITRNRGLQKLEGYVYTEGKPWTPESLRSEPQFVFASLWEELIPDYEATIKNGFLITDADVMSGMSGGPVITPEFKIVAVTTTALLPGNIWRYDGARSFEEGYNFGIHGAIHVSEIQQQILSLGENPKTYFDCPP